MVLGLEGQPKFLTDGAVLDFLSLSGSEPGVIHHLRSKCLLWFGSLRLTDYLGCFAALLLL